MGSAGCIAAGVMNKENHYVSLERARRERMVFVHDSKTLPKTVEELERLKEIEMRKDMERYPEDDFDGWRQVPEGYLYVNNWGCGNRSGRCSIPVFSSFRSNERYFD